MVKHWTTPNDANHSNRHAECNGVEFFAFPYQNYSARVGNLLAVVSKYNHSLSGFGVRILDCLPNGSNLPKSSAFFASIDEAFEHASKVLKGEKS
jgi:hypothetical protein